MSPASWMRSGRGRRARSVATSAGAGLLGAYVALVLAGPTVQPVGPFEARLSLRPALHGSSVLAVPPLGDLRFDTHAGPVELEARLVGVDTAAVEELAGSSDLRAVGEDVRADLQRALVVLLVRDTAVVLLGGGVAGLLLLRAPRRALGSAGCVLGVLAAATLTVVSTADADALSQPEYSGVLAYAPSVIGDARDVVRRLDDYNRQLGRLVTNVSTLYSTASTLPSYTATADSVRLLHVSDLHLSPSAFPLIRSVAEQFDVDLVVDTGDIADHGSTVEDAYVGGIASVTGTGVPYVYVRGNHDSAGTEAAVRSQPGAVVLDDGFPVEVAGLTLVGEADPRFTPDKTTLDDDTPEQLLLAVGRHLRDVVAQQPDLPEVVAVHDPASAPPLVGEVPLVLAGHRHEREVTVEDGTRLMVQGSTGGAGLRALEGDEPTPVQMTVLYLDRATGDLRAYDEITLGGLGLSDARISRVVVPPEPAPAPSPAP